MNGAGSVNISTSTTTPVAPPSMAEPWSCPAATTSTPPAVTVNAGTLTLSGSNTYTGGTTVSAATLNINNNSAIGSGCIGDRC